MSIKFKTIASATVLAAVAALSAGVASAQGLTRAEVKAQVIAAERDGTLNALDGQDSGSAYLAAHFHPTETRSEVRADLAAAKANGTLDALDGQDSGSAFLAANFHSTTPRSDVKAELANAERNGTLDALTGQDSGSFALSHVEQTHPRSTAFATK